AGLLDLQQVEAGLVRELRGEPLDVVRAPHGSTGRTVPDSCWSRSCVFRAIRAEKSVGNASASSRALVCSDCVCPWVEAMASMQVRATLLNTSCAVSDQPEVCECVRRDRDLAFFGSNFSTSSLHNRRPARSLAISMEKFIPIAQKNDRRGANLSMSRPESRPARMSSTPSASVYASSRSAVAPASCMWCPEIEMELNRGIFCEV